MTQDPSGLAKSIDHTLLRAESTEIQFEKLCEEAREHSFMSVCIPPTWLKYCASRLEGSDVKLCTVVGFPLGYHQPQTKEKEAELAIQDGAHELDVVLNFAALINGDLQSVRSELKSLRSISKDKTLKLIVETCYLSNELKKQACELVLEYEWDFVKTSTGFGSAGATLDDVKLMKSVVMDGAGVKASGGIRNTDTALKMIAAGASRLGTSDSVAIVTGVGTGKGNY